MTHFLSYCFLKLYCLCPRLYLNLLNCLNQNCLNQSCLSLYLSRVMLNYNSYRKFEQVALWFLELQGKYLLSMQWQLFTVEKDQQLLRGCQIMEKVQLMIKFLLLLQGYFQSKFEALAVAIVLAEVMVKVSQWSWELEGQLWAQQEQRELDIGQGKFELYQLKRKCLEQTQKKWNSMHQDHKDCCQHFLAQYQLQVQIWMQMRKDRWSLVVCWYCNYKLAEYQSQYQPARWLDLTSYMQVEQQCMVYQSLEFEKSSMEKQWQACKRKHMGRSFKNLRG